jgi:hypothetical protein
VPAVADISPNIMFYIFNGNYHETPTAG